MRDAVVAAVRAAKRVAAPPPQAARATGKKRSPALITRTTTRLLVEIKAHPGQRIEQIGKAMNIATKDLKLPGQRLLDQAKIMSRGVKRATAYFPA